mgnify:CR=1 FL=1
MKSYKESITLNQNSRGCVIIDTVKGCTAGALHEERGCYGDCYAKNIADRYGFDFLDVKTRKFDENLDQLLLAGFTDDAHKNRIVREIRASDMPFVRIGEMGDPSLDWEHTLSVCNDIVEAGKPIVIITKHWKAIPDAALPWLAKLGLCINTSASALDTEKEIEYRIAQFERLKPYCKSILRIVSCDFNRDNSEGLSRAIAQERLFLVGGDMALDTVFRPTSKNVFVERGVINIQRVKFMRSVVLASVYKPDTYRGMCQTCPEMCGVTMGAAK